MTFDCEVATVACMQAAADNFQTPLLIWGTVTGRSPTQIVLHRIDGGQEAGEHTLDVTLDDLREADLALNDIVTAFLDRRSYQAPVTLFITTDPTDADVYLSDQSLGQTPLRTKVPAGDHRISIEKEGFEHIRQPVLLRDRRSELEYRLVRIMPESRVTPIAVEVPTSPTHRGAAFWTTIGSGAIAIAAVAGYVLWS